MTEYDVFVSYAHRDNHDGWVEAFVAAIREEHAHFMPTALRVFLDLEGIRSMDDWEHRILSALRSSKIMLAVLSPYFFESRYCRKEWEIWVEHELARALPGEGIASVYTVTAPAFEDEAPASLDKWLSNMRRRQYTDVREWRAEGPAALRWEDARRRVEALDQRIAEQLQRAERFAASPTTVPPHNEHFVGRTDELRQLHEALALGKVGAITAVHGLGGMGKSALAFEYAHAYADHYPGGRFLVPCAGVEDVRIPIVNLAEHMGVKLTDDERKDLAAAFARVRAAFERGERALLLLDNVDDPKLLAPALRATVLPSGEKVHVLVTTRLEPDRLTGLACVALDALPEADALRLLEKYRPFDTDEEREAARSIVRRVDGFPLAVEVVGVYLWKTADEGVTYAGYLARLRAEGLASLEGVARDDRVTLARHHQKVLSDLLEPTLGRLSPEELLTVEYAASLPPDTIALPWLQALVALTFPGIVRSMPGYPDPWARMTRRLLGLRLLRAGDDHRIVRMHRIVQEVVGNRPPALSRLVSLVQSLATHAWHRGLSLAHAWTEPVHRWEIGPVLECARYLLGRGISAGCLLANLIFTPLRELGRIGAARALITEAIDVLRSTDPTDAKLLAECLVNLAAVERDQGDFQRAIDLMRQVLAIEEKAATFDHPSVSVCYAEMACTAQLNGNAADARLLTRRALERLELDPFSTERPLQLYYSALAVAELDAGAAAEAKWLMGRAIAVCLAKGSRARTALAGAYQTLAVIETTLGNVARAQDALEQGSRVVSSEDADRRLPPILNQRALLELDWGSADRARQLLRQAIAIWQRTLEPEHPTLLVAHNNLAQAERAAGRLVESRALMKWVLECQLRVLGSSHPALADTYDNLAKIEVEEEHFSAAGQLMRKAFTVQRRAIPADHPHRARTYANCGALRLKMGQLQKARRWFVRALRLDRRVLPADHPSIAGSCNNLARIEERLGNGRSAMELMGEAHTILMARFGAKHPQTVATEEWLTQRGQQAASEDPGHTI